MRFFKLTPADSDAAAGNGAFAAEQEARLSTKLRALRAQEGVTTSQLEAAVAERPTADGHYMTVLAEMADTSVFHLNINCADIAHFNEECAELYEVRRHVCNRNTSAHWNTFSLCAANHQVPHRGDSPDGPDRQ